MTNYDAMILLLVEILNKYHEKATDDNAAEIRGVFGADWGESYDPAPTSA